MSTRQNVEATNASNGIDEIFSYMCSLAVQKCSKKAEKKKASCGGAAMRKRLLIKNFVTQMLDQEKAMNMNREQLSREVNIPGQRTNKHSKIPQTRIDEEMDNEEDELDVEETDELIEDQYQPLNDGRSTRRSGSLSDDEEEEAGSLDERLTIADTLNNNSSLSSTRTNQTSLPGIGCLCGNCVACGDFLTDSTEYSSTAGVSCADFLAETIEYSNNGGSCADFLADPNGYSTGASVPVTTSDSYGLTYCHDDFSLSNIVTVTSASELYPLSTVADSSSPYLISTCVAGDSTPSHALCGSNTFEATQLPTNFMEEPPVNDQPSMTTLTTVVSSTLTTLTSTSGSAELRHLHALTNNRSAEEQNVHFDSMNHRDLSFGNTEDNAQKEEPKEKSDNKEVHESKFISTAFVDLVNVVPINKLGDCRREAFQDFAGSRHITDLDSNEIQVSNLLPDIIDANGQARSPRKRLNTMDYAGGLMSMAVLSPKRIKL